jgi:mRNA interferase RelE/StbE
MYRLVYEERVISVDIPLLPLSARTLIQRAINERLTTNPNAYGKPMRRSLAGHRRLRVSQYRIIYRIDEKQKIVYISTIGHRKDVYE